MNDINKKISRDFMRLSNVVLFVTNDINDNWALLIGRSWLSYFYLENNFNSSTFSAVNKTNDLELKPKNALCRASLRKHTCFQQIRFKFLSLTSKLKNFGHYKHSLMTNHFLCIGLLALRARLHWVSAMSLVMSLWLNCLD